MNDDSSGGSGWLDRLVDAAARTMDSLGLNGTRLRWKWNQRRARLAEAGARAELLWRSARSKHKMCPACRALVERNAAQCDACGASLATVRAPGISRLLSNLLPGATATTSLILLVNGLFFMLMLMVPTPAGAATGGFGRLLSFDIHTLNRFGGNLGALVMLDGEWWRLVTSMFLHGGLIHFGFNSFVLMQVGPLVEETYGTERFWVIYVLSGISGNLASLVFETHRTVIGASGAIVGLIGLLLAYGLRRGGALGESIKSAMIRYAIYILVFSLLPGISLANHAGGFAGGLLLGLLIPVGEFRSRSLAALWQVLSLAMVGLVLFAFYQVAQHGSDYLKYFG